jgi:hypothetical protein
LDEHVHSLSNLKNHAMGLEEALRRDFVMRVKVDVLRSQDDCRVMLERITMANQWKIEQKSVVAYQKILASRPGLGPGS